MRRFACSGPIQVLTPLQYVSMHVVKAKRIRLLLSDRVRLFAAVVFIPRHVTQCAFRDLRSIRKLAVIASRCRTAGVFPLLFRRKAERQSRLLHFWHGVQIEARGGQSLRLHDAKKSWKWCHSLGCVRVSSSRNAAYWRRISSAFAPLPPSNCLKCAS